MNGLTPQPLIAEFFKGSYRHIELDGQKTEIRYIKSKLDSGSALMQFGFVLPQANIGTTFRPFERVQNISESRYTIKADPKARKPTDVSTVTARVMTNQPANGSQVDRQFSRSVQQQSNKISDANKKYVENVAGAYERVSKIPPLVMLVNPERIVAKYEQSSGVTMGRRAHIVSNWLEKPIEITAEGTTLGFYAFGPESDGSTSGITHHYRIESLAYGNFMSLLALYLDNANLAPQGVVNPLIADITIGVTNLYLYYDNTYYLGSFDTMTVNDSADKPHTLRYNFTYHARYCYRM